MLPLIMLSLKPLYFEAVCAGRKRTEFRRFVYLENKPALLSYLRRKTGLPQEMPSDLLL